MGYPARPGTVGRLASYPNVIRAVLASLQLSIADAASLPPPTGPYQVGITRHTIEHFNPRDPLAPNKVSTAFLATIFYPTLQKPGGAPELYLNPKTAAYFENSWNYTWGGPVGQPPYPTILFGPGGGGPPVEGSTIPLAELASHGYTVIGLDHPFEQPFLRYPNGTGAYGIDIDFNDLQLLEAIYRTRLVDNAVLLKRLPKLVQQLKAPFNISHFGALGYSLGGAASFGSMYGDARFVSGLNPDGSLFGRPSSVFADVKKPVFLLASEYHSGEGEQADSSWQIFLSRQTGYVREIFVIGTTHY
ncbi:hypothetical protein AAE478_010440 [Parahypoxylon ruwenzoriense]